MSASRILAGLALLAALGAVVAVIAGSGSGGSAPAQRGPVAAPARVHRAPPPRPRKVRGPHDRPVPILMYHVVSDPQPGAPDPELYTPAPAFARQMEALSRAGYHGVTLAQVDRYWRQGYALPHKPVVVSFDDGYLSHYTHAAPVLKRLRWPGVLNLEIHNVTTPGDISQREVRVLIRQGWEIDSHTLTHPDLTQVSATQLRDELVRSRAFLRRRFRVPADYFCYPAGRFDARVEAAVRAAGYRLATTTQPGLASPKGDRLALDRIRVDGLDTGATLLAKIHHPPTVQTGYPGG